MPLINTRGAASIKGFGFAGFSPTVPGMPTSVSATATSCSAISVSFTAPACNGGLSIDYYQAVCTASGTHSATGTSPISVTGLSGGTSYTFKVRAHNGVGYGCYSSSTGTATTNAAASSLSYTSPGSYCFVTPAGVTSVSAVTVGGGEGGGHGSFVGSCCCAHPDGGFSGTGAMLRYVNNISVTPTVSYSVYVAGGGTPNNWGGSSYFKNSSTVLAQGGKCNAYLPSYPGVGSGGNGGNICHICASGLGGGGGGGAGGYTGNGGAGYQGAGTGAAGSGGGGGGGGKTATSTGGGGGGVGLFGQGSNGSGGVVGGGGSGGSSGANSGTTKGGNGGGYGGGGGGGWGCNGGCGAAGGYGGAGAVRVIWPGSSRSFPSSSVGSP